MADFMRGDADEIDAAGGNAVGAIEIPGVERAERYRTIAAAGITAGVDRVQTQRLDLCRVDLDVEVIERIVVVEETRRAVDRACCRRPVGHKSQCWPGLQR